MKKTLTKLFGLALALFASQNMTAQSELLLDEPFAGSLGGFTVEGFNGANNNIWSAGSDFVTADAFGKIGATEALENYLVSPEINLGSDGKVNFQYSWRFFSDYPSETAFVVRTVGGEWQSLEYNYVGDIVIGESGDIVIPETFNGRTIQVGFKYTSAGNNSSGIWDIKNLKVYGVKGVNSDEQISSDIYYGVNEVTYAMGSGDFDAPVLDNPYGVEVNYESSDVNVASIDAQGTVTINGVGVTTIKATAVETEKYWSTTASYVLTVTEGGAETGIIFEEPFTKGFGEFVVEGFNGIDPNCPIWVFEGFAKADAYGKIEGPVENYLVSPVITLGNETAVAHFNHGVEYFNDPFTETGLCIRTVGGEWQSLMIPVYPEYSGTVLNTGNIEIPAEFNGQDVQFGFKYTAQESSNAGIWSIQQFVVEKTGAAEKADPEIAFDQNEVFYMLESGDFTEPVLANPNNVTVKYSTSDYAVATVDAQTGKVSIVGEGTTTITAVSEENDLFAAGTASYTLTVTAKAVTDVVFVETFKDSFGEFKIEGYNGVNNNIWSHDVAFVTADAYGKIEEPVENYLVSPVIKLGSENHIAHYLQSQDYFNSFAKETSFLIREVGGEWTKLKMVNIPVTGNWSESGNISIPEEFNGKEVQFGFKYTAQSSGSAGVWSLSNFTVEKVCSGTDPKLSYGVSEAVGYIGHEFTAPDINNPYEVEISYNSSNPEVATVDAQTGAVTLVAVGTTTITAVSVANDTFVSGSASYELTVKEASAEDVIFEAYFEDDFCGFAVEGFNGDEMPIWKIKNGSARADAFTKVSEPTTNYLVSPVIRMSETDNTAEFNYKYLHDSNSTTAAEDEFGFCIREVGGEWESLIIPNFDATNTMVSSGKIAIPAEYAGKKVQVAFMYFAESGNTSGVLSVEDIIIRKAVPTAIEGITADDIMNGKVYNLQGMRADKLAKGIYIVNGKKVVVK